MRNIDERLRLLRKEMRKEHIGAYIINSCDPHQSEYVAPRWQGRKWISGFDGSAGTAVVTLTGAALWTDSRYFIAAEEQLRGTEFQLMRLRVEGTPTIAEWIAQQLKDNDDLMVATDGTCMSHAEALDMANDLQANGPRGFVTYIDLLDRIWTDRPPMPSQPIHIHPLAFAGISAAEKLSRIRVAIKAAHADALFVSALDSIAWTLNLRGSDIDYNPVFMAHLLIEETRATLFIHKEKVSPQVESYLLGEGVQLAEYTDAARALNSLTERTIMIDPKEISANLYNEIYGDTRWAVPSPIQKLKAVKNEAEIQGFRTAMVRDGVAMVRLLQWIETAVPQGGESELSVAEKLEELKREFTSYRGPSFETISAYEQHAAIVHYEPTPQSNSPLEPRGMLLLDCGSQYAEGTTDITRTIPLGPVSTLQKQVYTLVLKAHIALERAIFPEGISGTQIDPVVRSVLWREGLNFGHGTGHGVGSYLNVHEGPHQVRHEWVGAPLLEHMTVTDEPGVYLEGQFGVRIENLLCLQHHQTTPFGRFLCMESLTLCPISTEPILIDLLTDDELAWLNSYHQRVREVLSPRLDEKSQQWLQIHTEPLTRQRAEDRI